MDKFGKSQSVKRTEDVRFLTGAGGYVDDVAPEGALHAVFLRAPVAHAEINHIDVEAARDVGGVRMILTGADLGAAGIDKTMRMSTVTNRDGSKGRAPKRPLLAQDRMRFVGEPVAMIVAETLQAARDAAEVIDIDYNDLEAKLDVSPGGAALYDTVPDNIAFDYERGDVDATDAAFDTAARVIKTRVYDNRIMASSMEPRGCYAEPDGDRIHLCVNGQGVWGVRDDIARFFDLDPADVRVTHPDVGGGFGMKAMNYPEYPLVTYAARTLGQPVRWMSERTEAMLTDNAGRDLVTETELAFDEDHRIVGYRLHTLCNLGACNSQFAQPIQTDLFARVAVGTYDIQNFSMRVQGVFTNTTQVDAYRGAGRPEAIFALERSIDNAARALGVDPLELRRKNFVRPDQFPHETAVGELYDVGEFERVLNRAALEADCAGFAKRKAEAAARGRLLGQGVCYYIEAILGNPQESVEIVFTEDGRATIAVGTQSNGQGHETAFTQFLSDQTGIPADKIDFIQGDSDLIATGGGTGGSRSATVQTHVTLVAAGTMIAAYKAFLSDALGAAPEDIAFDDETFRAEGSNLTPTFLEAAEMAREAGRDDLLAFRQTAKLPGRSYPNGAHIAEVEVDPETGESEVVKYTVADDFGNLINPMLAEGQVHGGVAQGIGQIMTENVVYDDSGQLLTASYMDYAFPRAEAIPRIEFHSEPVPSTANPMGMKGCGEAGTVGALAAVSNAMIDALAERGITNADAPFTPLRVWSLLNDAKSAAA